MAKKLYTAMYHYTRELKNSRYPEIRGLDKELFIKQLDFFEKNFNVVTMESVIDAFNSEKGDLPENALLLTFDDGYIDNFVTAFPLLKERGMQGSFFIPGKTITEKKLLDVNKVHFILASAKIDDIVTKLKKYIEEYRSEYEYPSIDELWAEWAVPNRFDDAGTIFVKRILQTVLPEKLRGIVSDRLFDEFVGVPETVFAGELYMNHDQIKFMKNEGMFIGIHGYDHYWLANLEPSEMEKDIDKALEIMSPYVDSNSWVLNYPYGNYSDSVINYIEKRGCKLAMTTNVGIGEIGVHNKFTVPRLDCNDFPPKSEKYNEF